MGDASDRLDRRRGCHRGRGRPVAARAGSARRAPGRRSDASGARRSRLRRDAGRVAAAEEDRLRALVLIAATPRWGDWFLPFWPIEEDRIDYLRAIRSLDPIECIGKAAPAAVLMQFGRRDFFIAPMSGLEFRGAAPEGTELKPYDAEHDMRLPEIRADRRAFLARHLGFADG